jgi:hypothetical protein
MRFRCLLLLTFVLATPACMQQAAREQDTAAPGVAATFAQLNALRRQSRGLKTPLAEYAFYLDHYEHSQGGVRGFLAQVLAALEAELGAYEQAVRRYPQQPLLRGTPAALADTENFRAVDAAGAIAELARERRIVVINEAHHVGQTRLVSLQLLPRLRALGFTHFAAEGLDERDRDLTTRGYPVKASGPYVNDPLYGEIIRKAFKLGFVVVPYDSTTADADVATREEDQAVHLRDRVFREQPDARLFIHAGYAHIHKRAEYFYTDTMAMRLKRKTGFDPLSIDQTVLRPIAPGLEYKDYRSLVQRFAPATPSVLLARDGHSAWSLEPAIYDVSVILPPTRLVNGRPDWLRADGRIEVAIDVDLQPTSLPCVVEARYAAESGAAVPADRLLIEHAGDQVVLFLRPGDYRLDALRVDGRTFFSQRLHVDPALATSPRLPKPPASR